MYTHRLHELINTVVLRGEREGGRGKGGERELGGINIDGMGCTAYISN